MILIALSLFITQGQKIRSFNRWDQFMAMLIGHISGRKSLRDITDNIKAQ
ncbi:MAG: DUF4372 domain-containing protein [Deltaproteobacteria bacterium]|jgi:hypothetical protein|nr:DUF4372 domain-containing protein [Deltaproteobacteria bacterium]